MTSPIRPTRPAGSPGAATGPRNRPAPRIDPRYRSKVQRGMLVAAAALLATVAVVPVDQLAAAVTGRSSVPGNRFVTDTKASDPYGVHTAKISPATGRSFVDGAQGQITFSLFAATSAPNPFPAVKAGDTIEIVTELPSSLRPSSTFGWCDPAATGGARNVVTAACTTEERPDGSSAVRTTLTAKADLTSAAQWSALKANTIGVVAEAGQVAGSDTAHLTIAFPDDADHFRDRSAELPFTTAVGLASSLDVRNATAAQTTPSSNNIWYPGEQGYVRFETGLGDTESRGVTMRTGESFTYTIDGLGDANTSLVFDPHPDPASTTENSCARTVPGYDIRCEVVGRTISFITTRTGPDVVDDRPIGATAAIPLIGKQPPGPAVYVEPRVSLSVDMDQLGSRPVAQTAPPVWIWGDYRAGLGVHDLAVTPYVGQSFANDGRGRLTFDFFPGTPPTTLWDIVRSGDRLTMTLNLGTAFTVETERTEVWHGDTTRNWCDQQDAWGSDLDGYLSAPDCTAAVDDATGATTLTLTARALRNVPNTLLADGVHVRVRSASTSTDATHQLTATIASSRAHAVVRPFRQGDADVITIDNESSSLGTWRAEAGTRSGNPGTIPEGQVSWFSDPGNNAPGFWPFAVDAGDTLTYRVDLPEGLAYTDAPTVDTANVCTEPDRYAGFTGSCAIDGRTIAYTLTRTGPSEGWVMLDQSLPLTIPVVHETADDTVSGDVTITLDTSIEQSGSEHRRAIVPLQAPTPNGYGIHAPSMKPFLSESFIDGAEGAIEFDFFDGDAAPADTPRVLAGEQFVITADLPASLEFTNAYGWCQYNGPLQHRIHGYIDTVCDVTDHADGSSSLRLIVAAKKSLPTAAGFWAFIKDNQIGVVARDGQVDGTGSAHVTITFPDDADHLRTRTAELTFATRAGGAPR